MQSTAFPAPHPAVPSVAILGTDALLAARPAAAAQLARACLRAGFSGVVPASWGDELVAQEALRQLAERPGRPAIQCSCPHVASRLLASGAGIADFLLPVVAPPVAVARYVRGLHRGPVHLTYVGACPAAQSAEIDARLTPLALLTALADRGIVIEAESADDAPAVLGESRRFYSLPGGLPAPAFLDRELRPRRAVEPTAANYSAEVAEHLMSGEAVLVDVAPRLGCACAGAGAGVPAAEARAAAAAFEPPRAAAAVLDASVVVSMRQTLEQLAPGAAARGDVLPIIGDSSVPAALPRRAPDAPRRPSATPLGNQRRGESVRAAAPRRPMKTPLGVPRMTPGGTPAARGAAPPQRPIPRAYGLHRPSSRTPAAPHRAAPADGPPGSRPPESPTARSPLAEGGAGDEMRPIELGNESEQPLVHGADRAARLRSWTPYEGAPTRGEGARAGTVRNHTVRDVAARPRRRRGLRLGWLGALATAVVILGAGATVGGVLARRGAALAPDSDEFVTVSTPVRDSQAPAPQAAARRPAERRVVTGADSAQRRARAADGRRGTSRTRTAAAVPTTPALADSARPSAAPLRRSSAAATGMPAHPARPAPSPRAPAPPSAPRPGPGVVAPSGSPPAAAPAARPAAAPPATAPAAAPPAATPPAPRPDSVRRDAAPPPGA